MHKRIIHEHILKFLLTETYINVFDEKSKRKYIDDVWDILQSSYAKIGGIHGSGFSSKQDMIDNMPFWKLARVGGKIVAVAIYKDKKGRKRVAAGTDGSREGKTAFADIASSDLSQGRSYSELSGPSLVFVKKRYKGDLQKHLIKPQDVEAILGTKIEYPVGDQDAEVLLHPELKDYFYTREIGGGSHTKLMLGTPEKSIH